MFGLASRQHRDMWAKLGSAIWSEMGRCFLRKDHNSFSCVPTGKNKALVQGESFNLRATIGLKSNPIFSKDIYCRYLPTYM